MAGRKLGVNVSLSADLVETFERSKREQARRRVSSKSIGGRDPSLRWPHLYDILRAKGHDKSSAAAISNAHLKHRKKGKLQGLPWKKADNKKALKALISSAMIVDVLQSAIEKVDDPKA